jgi:hypothetical protein
MSNEKIEAFWENATADDVAKIANTRKSIQARFRDEDNEDWVDCLLAGWKLSRHLPGARWIDADGAMWNHCQVYREPSWWTNKPDPGPGFRLLGKLPDEELKPGDELWLKCNKSWELSDNAHSSDPKQEEQVWYRRRIEPKFAVGQTVKVVGPKVSDAKQWDSEMARHVGTLQTIKYIEGFANPPEIFYGVYGIDSRTFREDYLEPVEPVESKPLLIRRRVVEIGDEIKLPNGRVLVFNGEGFEVVQ